MENALGEPQTIVLLGGTSEIGLAIVRALLSPTTRNVVLACRDLDRRRTRRGADSAAWLPHRRRSCRSTALAPSSHPEFVAIGVGEVRRHRRGHRRLRRPGRRGRRPRCDSDAAAEVAHVNFTGAVSSTIAIANQMRGQGHGSIVMLSSVAGERVRQANPVYGASKAGLDGFAQGLGDALAADGVHMVIVRPGFVHSKMTTGLDGHSVCFHT